MNVILLHQHEMAAPLPPHDPRVHHLRTVLKARQGQFVQAGVVGGFLCPASVHFLPDGSVRLAFAGRAELPPPRLPLTLVISVPRPPTARRLLRDLTTLGVERLIWTTSELTEKSYLSSSLWTHGEWEWEVLLGAMQGKTCLLPEVHRSEAFHQLPTFTADIPHRLVLDPSGDPFPMDRRFPLTVAVGPERGWTEEELAAFRKWGWTPCRLGRTTLRTETAALGAAVLVTRNLLG